MAAIDLCCEAPPIAAMGRSYRESTTNKPDRFSLNEFLRIPGSRAAQ